MESAKEALLQPVRCGVDGYDGVEQLECRPEPGAEPGLLLQDSGENRASLRSPLFSSSS